MNYTRAAERLHITQPAVSQHIRHLEEFYGVRLFVYEGKRLGLTEAGAALYRTALVQKNDEERLIEQLQSVSGTGRQLRFGVTLTIGEFVIGAPLSRYLKQEPEVCVHLVTGNTRELLAKLREGEIGFALLEGNFPKEECASTVYSSEQFIAVRGRDYRLRGRAQKLEDLLGERLILREEGSGTREVLQKDLERRNLSPEDFWQADEIGNMNAIKTLVKEGCGITFLYEAAVREELEAGTLVRIPLQDFEAVHDFSFVWQKGSLFEREYRKIFEQLKG